MQSDEVNERIAGIVLQWCSHILKNGDYRIANRVYVGDRVGSCLIG